MAIVIPTNLGQCLAAPDFEASSAVERHKTEYHTKLDAYNLAEDVKMAV